MNHLIIIFLLLLASGLFAQDKYEREYRLDETAIPAAARDFVAACAFSKRIKWLGEENLDHRSP